MIKIITDTTSCLSLENSQSLDIPRLPQIIIFGEQSFRDDFEISSDVFIQKLKNSPVLPKTSAPQPELYIPIYRSRIEQGNSILVLCPSTEVSGTFRGATIGAQEFPDANIKIIDTRTIGSGFGQLVLYAQKLINEGFDLETIISKVKEMQSREKLYFLVDTLEYLYKGGRIGGAKALFGSILQVKPILELRNGRPEAVESQRTKTRAMARFKNIIYSQCPKGSEAHLTIMHGDNIEEAHKLALELKQNLEIPEVSLYYLPPAIMVHAGPGVLAVSFFTAP